MTMTITNRRAVPSFCLDHANPDPGLRTEVGPAANENHDLLPCLHINLAIPGRAAYCEKPARWASVGPCAGCGAPDTIAGRQDGLPVCDTCKARVCGGCDNWVPVAQWNDAAGACWFHAPAECWSCGDTRPAGEMRPYGPERACKECSILCNNCDTTVLVDDAAGPGCADCYAWCDVCDDYVANRDYAGNDLCRNHGFFCDSCDKYVTEGNYSGNGLCMECGRYCETCGETVPVGDHTGDDLCYDCSDDDAAPPRARGGMCGKCVDDGHGPCHDHDTTIAPYGKTYPQQHNYRGGPLPRTPDGRLDGFYVAFELEIGTNDPAPAHVRAWAEEHLDDAGQIECKQDSTVAGYELAAMPMTPEYFESVDWDGFMAMLNATNPLQDHFGGDEPDAHGLHVHIGNIAFRDGFERGAFAHLMARTGVMAATANRDATGFCHWSPAMAAKGIATAEGTPWARADGLRKKHGHVSRNAEVNLTGSKTVELRRFKSTRDAHELRDAVRSVYMAAEYVRAGRPAGTPMSVWLSQSEFMEYVAGRDRGQHLRWRDQLEQAEDLRDPVGVPAPVFGLVA